MTVVALVVSVGGGVVGSCVVEVGARVVDMGVGALVVSVDGAVVGVVEV